MSCIVFTESRRRPSHRWPRVHMKEHLCRPTTARRYERKEEKTTEACGAGVWKTETTETPHHQLHHYRHPHLRDPAQAMSCHWQLFMSELGKDQ